MARVARAIGDANETKARLLSRAALRAGGSSGQKRSMRRRTRSRARARSRSIRRSRSPTSASATATSSRSTARARGLGRHLRRRDPLRHQDRGVQALRQQERPALQRRVLRRPAARPLAVGTYGGGLSLLDEKDETWETFNIPDGLGDAFVYEVMETRGGDVWIATWSGVNRIRGGELRDRSKWELYTVDNTKGGLPNDWVYGLAEGKNGEIWLATEGGLARFRKGQMGQLEPRQGPGRAVREGEERHRLQVRSVQGLHAPRPPEGGDGAAEHRRGLQPELHRRDGGRRGGHRVGRHLGRRARALRRQEVEELHHRRGPARQPRLHAAHRPARRAVGRHQQRPRPDAERALRACRYCYRNARVSARGSSGA